MKKTILGLLAIAALTFFTSCEKEQLQSTLEQEIAGEYESFTVPSSNYESVVTAPLVNDDDGEHYIAGTIEYRDNGQTIATVDFGNGERDRRARLNMNDEDSDFDLNRNQGSRSGSGYTKVIITPLVKIPGCDYIVEGVIQYLKNGVVVATIDFGDGTCDEWAVKSCPGETDYKFSLKDAKKKKSWIKKKKKK